MKKKIYAIVDIETTGGRMNRDKIIEIAIALHDGEKVIDTYETLINPERTIPYGITELTGISYDMVKNAPKFYEVAKKIVEMTEGAVFVAHNARFDYGFIREEFKQLGYTYSRRMLCTVRLGRQTIPGLKSYSLDSLIRYLKIKVKNRHRAMGDVQATITLLEHVFAKRDSEQEVHQLINLGIKESQLPNNITLDTLHALPEECGVYYLMDECNEVLYVGKSINIKKRVMEHFAKMTEKAKKLQQRVHEIHFELMGSELLALLFESHEIKRLRPPVNRAQRHRHFPYVIHQFKNEQGYNCLDVTKATAKTRPSLNIVGEYPKTGNARGYLQRAIESYELCHRLCGLDANIGNCFYYQIKMCKGACAGHEAADVYNQRVGKAIEMLKISFGDDFFIIDKGRTREERSVVFIENGFYQGFGYVDVEDASNKQMLKDVIKPYNSNPETIRIIRQFLSKNPKVKKLKVRTRKSIKQTQRL